MIREHTSFNDHPGGELIPRSETDPFPARSGRFYPQADPGAETGRGLLLEYGQILNRNKGSILVFALLGIVTAFLYTVSRTPIYQSRTSVELQTLNDNFLNLKSSDPTISLPDYSPEGYIETQIKILQSNALISRVFAKINERQPKNTGQTSQPRAGWRKVLQLPVKKAAAAREEALAYAAGSLLIRPVGTSHIIEIFSDSPDPQVAADFVNTLVSEFIDHSLERRLKTSQHTGTWLTGQLQDLKSKLQKSENELQAYAQAAGLMFTGEKSSVAEDKLRNAQQELAKAQAERVLKQSKYESSTSNTADGLPEVLDDHSVREYELKLTDLRRQLAELSSALMPTHYKVERVQAQIDEIQRALEKAQSAIVKRLGNEFEAAQRRERLLSGDYNRQYRLVSSQLEKTVHYDLLRREVETNRQVYEAMLQKVKETSVTSAMHASNISVVDAAEPSPRPYKPDRFRNCAMGLMAGLLLGTTFVFVRDRADRSIQTPGETPAYLHLAELGVIPSAEKDRNELPPGSNQLPGDHSEENGTRRLSDCVELVTWKRKPSMLAESFRATLASILFSCRNGAKSSVIVFTSSAPAEGKTTVVSNIGVAMSETRRRVLLIDADLRRPRLHTIFSLENTRGLTNILKSDRPVADFPLEDLIRQTGMSGLFVLPSGPAPESISDVLYSVRLGELLLQTRKLFDVVLIDTPPMLQISDARVLGRLADGVILVIRAGKTTRDTAIRAAGRFMEDGTPVLGTILNDWNPEGRAGLGYQGYYQDYYQYSRPS